MKGGGTKCQTLGWWQMNEAVLRPEKIKKKMLDVLDTRYENDSKTLCQVYKNYSLIDLTFEVSQT